MNINDIFVKYNCKPKGIIHIGACMCEELTIYLKHGISINDIIWIEGNPETYETAKAFLPKNVKLYCGLIAESSYDVNFTVTNNIYSSSILELKDHSTLHPDVISTKKLNLRTTTLGSFLLKHKLNINNYDLLVMDIQGAEMLALQGMSDLINKFNYVFLEVSIVELYEGNAKFDEIKKFLSKHNFELVHHVINCYNWGDAFFVKK